MSTFSADNAWIKRTHSNPTASLRLFCFPYAGGGASIFHSWDSALPSWVELCPIQLPGRENRLRETPFTQLSSLVHYLVPVLYPYLELPFAFFGHSMGALISFELARQLRTQGISPVHLFISGRRAPQIPDRNPRMYTLSNPEFLEELRQLNGMSDKVLNSSELMELLLPTLRSDFEMCGTYTYESEPPLDCPISVFGGLEDTTEPRKYLEDWRIQTSSCFTLQMLPGDHFFLRTHQQFLLEQVVRKLNDRLFPTVNKVRN